jgi:hypothetical protein
MLKISMKNLGGVIAACWAAAEEATARAIAEKYPNPGEENITFLFGGELRASVAEESRKGSFARAFYADLLLVPGIGRHVLKAEGLVARVNLHSRWHEGRRSGSDLGMIVTKPSILWHPELREVEIVRDQARALLAQAKLNKSRQYRDGHISWGTLTKSQQKRFLPEYKEYSALLLYHLEDSARSKLAPFRWQLCRGSCSIGDIKSWLLSGAFPEEISSTDVIRRLSAGELGTDKKFYDSIVDPPASKFGAIEIRVYWPGGDDKGPPMRFGLHRSNEQEAHQHVSQNRS